MKRKSILKALLLTVLMCCLTFALVACGGKHTVTFNYGVDGNGDGEVDVVTVEVGDGSLLEEPTDVPTREGYTFVGWGTDNGMWNFEEDTVTADITLNARWSAGDPIDPGTPGTTVYVNYKLGVGAADSDSDSDPSFVPNRWSGAPGTTIKLPAEPDAGAGWEFTGWLVEKETELRAAGSDYTVTGTVTITAQWKSVAYTQYTWTIESGNEPGESKTGVATGTPVGGGKDITVDLPAFPADASGYAEYPTAGEYNVETTKATCTENAKDTLYYTIPQTQTYESYKLLIDVQSLPGKPAKGHLYTTWFVTQQPSATATGTATATCAHGCGKTLTITLPEITGNTGSGEGKYTEKAVQQQLSCEQDGIVDYVYTIPASDLADGDATDAAEGAVKTVSFTVTTPATGHKMVISVQTDTNTVTTATLQATCEHDNCDKGWDTQPVEATVTFDLGSGNVQSGGVTLVKENVTFDPETQFTVTLPDDDAMTLIAGTIFTGWKVGDTPYAAGSTISVAADGTIAVTGNFTKHTHNYGKATFVTSGDNAGKFVATCSEVGCPEPTVVVATTDGTFNPVLKNGTSVPIGHKLSAADFTVEVVYKYQIARDGHEIGEMYKKITPETDGYQSYFFNNLNTLSTAAWASGKQATFEFKVDGKTISSGKATFDVVPTAADIFGAAHDVQILYSRAGDASDLAVPALDDVSTTSGIAFSFWLDSEEINDWNAVVVNAGGFKITLPNLSSYENGSGVTGANVWPDTTDFRNNAVYSMYLANNSFVTVSINVSEGEISSVVFYRNGVEVINYAGTVVRENGISVATIASNLITQIAQNGFTFAGGNESNPNLAASNLLVTTQLDNTAAETIYNWYAPKYMTDDAALKSSVETALSGVTVHLVDAGPASATPVKGGDLAEITSLALTFYLKSTKNGEWAESRVITTSGSHFVNLATLDPFASEDLAGANLWPTGDQLKNGNTSNTFLAGNCYVTISITADKDICFYKNGQLAIEYKKTDGLNGGNGKTVADFVDALLSDIKTNGMRIGGYLPGDAGFTEISNLIVTSALDAAQVKTLYDTISAQS